MISQTNKVWLGGGAAGAVVITAAAWFFGIGPQLSQTSDLHSQQADVQVQNQTLQAKTNELKARSEHLPELRSTLQDELQALPITSNLSDLTVQLNSQARSAGVTIAGLTVGTPSSVSSTGGTSNAAASTGNPAGKTFAIQVNVISAGSLAGQRKFLLALQRTGPRAALVGSSTITGLSGATSVDDACAMTTQLTVFTTPMSPADAQRLATQLGTSTSN